MPGDANRKEALKKFVEEKAYAPENLTELAGKLADIATISTVGDVFIKRKCSNKDKIAAIAIARFLGARLKNEIKAKINAEVTREEVARYASTDKIIASARVKDLVEDGLLERVSRGVFRVKSLSQAEKWVDRLRKKYVIKR